MESGCADVMLSVPMYSHIIAVANAMAEEWPIDLIVESMDEATP